MKHFTLSKFPLENKTVLLRVDYNVPLKNNKVTDNTKIKASLPTIKYLLQKNCKIILATHLGRPQGKTVTSLKTDPLAKELGKLLDRRVVKLNDCLGKEIKEKISRSRSQLFLLENLRFYKEEESDNPAFAHSLANLAEIYVNDAFAVCHRKHASVHAITRFLPYLPGLLVEKEIKYLSKALKPARPAVWMIGGAKLDKVSFIKQALKKADYILIGGALAFSFLKAKGINVGVSKTSISSVKIAGQLLKKKKVVRKLILPHDFVAAEKFSAQAKIRTVFYNQFENHDMGLDLGPDTIELFKRYLRKAQTIVWNGPLGYFEWVKFAKSTKEIGRLLGKLTATSIVGGGETAEAMRKFHLAHNITHLSTGGGASLAYLSGEKLPGLVVLEKNWKRFRKKIK